MNELAILGTGAVMPDDANPGRIASLRRPDAAFTVAPVADEALREGAREPRLRRASRITLMMAAAARQALTGHDPERLGIVGAFFTGPCHFSRLFFQPVLERGPSFASPALFPETVYNSSLSHVAHLVGASEACYAAVGDDSAWVTALQIAAVWLELGVADRVLVLGAEELDASALEAYAAAGWLKCGFVPAEGSAAMLLGPAGVASDMRVAECLDGHAYRSRRSAEQAVRAAFSAMNGAPVLSTAGGTWLEPLVTGLNRPLIANDHARPGHAFTASAGWNTLRGLRWLADQPHPGDLWVPVPGLHHQVSGLRLRATGLQSRDRPDK